jgi:hypothetical protein
VHRNTVTARAPGGWSCAAVGRDLAVGGAGGPGTAWRPRAVRAPTSAHDALSRRVMTQLRRQSSSPGDISVTVTWPAVKAGCEALQAHEEALLLPRQAGILQPQGAVSPELQQSFCQEVMFRKQSQVREAQLPLLRQATCMQLAQPVDLLRWRCEGLCIARAQSVVDRVNDVVDHAPQCLRHCVGGATDTPSLPSAAGRAVSLDSATVDYDARCEHTASRCSRPIRRERRRGKNLARDPGRPVAPITCP